MEEPTNQPPKTAAERMTALFKQLAEKRRPIVQTAAKRMDATAATALAALNDLLRRLQKK